MVRDGGLEPHSKSKGGEVVGWRRRAQRLVAFCCTHAWCLPAHCRVLPARISSTADDLRNVAPTSTHAVHPRSGRRAPRVVVEVPIDGLVVGSNTEQPTADEA
jgi:hypothetical protein